MIRQGSTTVRQFRELIASIPEEYDDYAVTNCGHVNLEWIACSDKDKVLVIEFGFHPDSYPIKLQYRKD